MTRPITGRVAPGPRRSPGASASRQQPGTARIAVDLLGGDHAPDVVVDGALRACQADPALQLLLVGPVEAAGAVLDALDPLERPRVTTVAAPADRADLIRVTSPAELIPLQRTAAGVWDRRAGIESGVRAAVLAVAQGQAHAVVSAGDTGATVTSAALGLGRWPGVRRPALAAALPTAAGWLVLIDAGASLDPDEATLATHAALGAAYAAIVHGVDEPRVGLLTIGAEPGKGDRLRRAAAAALAATPLPAGARYAGPVEGNDVVLGGSVDVVVTDGFTGNVLLKGLETAYARTGPPPATQPVSPPPRAAVLLGVAGTVVVCHGAADATDLAGGIAFAADLHRRVAVAAIGELIKHTEVAHDQ